MNHLAAILKKINLLIIIIGLVVSIIELIGIYITNDVFFRIFFALITASVIWLGLIKLKNIYSLVAHLFLSIIIIIGNIAIIGFLYEVNHFVILIPHDYVGKIRIELNNHKSGVSINPTDKTIMVPIDSTGLFITKSDIYVPLYSVSIAEIKGKEISRPRESHLINIDFLKHDSIDGKYNLIKGDVIIKQDSTSIR